MLSNFLVFHTSGDISSRPAAFLFLILFSTMVSSSCVNCPSLMPCVFVWVIVAYYGGACGIMIIIIENGHGDTSSNSG